MCNNYNFTFLQVFFRAGVLGSLEEIRDDCLGRIITFLQSWIRGFTSRIGYRKLQEQRVALVVVQRNLRKFMAMANWSWFILWQRVKPLLHQERIEDVIRALQDRATLAQENLNRELTQRKELEEANLALVEEKNNLMLTLESSKGNITEFVEQQAKLAAQRNDLEAQLNVSFITRKYSLRKQALSFRPLSSCSENNCFDQVLRKLRDRLF